MSEQINSQPAVVDKLSLEIQDLTEKYKEAQKMGEHRGETIFYKTALRIAKARQVWEKEPLLKGRPFFREFRIGYWKKKSAIFQVENGQWCGAYVPWQKIHGDNLTDILVKMLKHEI